VVKVLAGALALVAAACGASATPSAIDAAPPDQLGVYPPGPYGLLVGDTLADFTALGYRLSPSATDASRLAFEQIKLSEVRAANADCRCLYLNVAASWCAVCQQQQPLLVSLVAPGGSTCIVQTLMQGTTAGTSATKSDLDTWAARYHQDFPLLMPNDAATHLLGATADYPTTAVVEAATMKLLGTRNGEAPVADLAALCPP
jgi:hypothetical protein